MSHEESKWMKYYEDLNRIKFYLSEDIFDFLIDELLSSLN